jgi:hypothetical protein
MSTAMMNGTPAIAGTFQPAPVKRGFPGLSCLGCGQEDTTSVHLDDMTFRCSECDSTFTPAEVAEQLERWRRVLSWVETAPAVE